MEEERIRPEEGTEYLLCAGAENSFKAIYIGRNPVETPEFIRSIRPEGHVFVRIGEKGLELYCARTSEEELTFMWYNEGFDGPYWPAGLQVGRDHTELSDLEKAYLNGLIRKLEEKNIQ
ncbi:MAG: hypothetical protein ACW963_04795 [Candidatus Sifarchaeia archaeon]|jgi:hypothetical protein